MNKTNNARRIWVDQSFMRFLKMESARQGKSILQLSRELAKGQTNDEKKFEFKF